MSESVIPAVLLRAPSEYKFIGHPLWRMADGKNHARVELTFHKKLPTLPIYKRGAENGRQPAPSAGEWPRQPTAARQPPPPTTRPTPPARRQPKKETTPPAPQILQIDTATITVPRPPKTAQITPPPIIQRPATPPPSPETPPSKKPRTKSPATTLHSRSTFMSTLRKSTLYTKSTSSRMSPLQSSRPSQKLQDYQETTKRSTSTYQSTSSTIETTNIGLLSRDLLQSFTTKSGTNTSSSFIREASNNETQHTGTTPWRNPAVTP